MQPEARRLIDLATRPLEGEPELRSEAEAVLGKAIEGSSPQQLAEAAAALAHADTHPHRRKWWIALYLLTLVVSLPLLAHTLKQVSRTSGIMGLPPSSPLETRKPLEVPNLTEKQKLLMDGDRNATNAADRWRPLWQSDPENAAYLAEYASAYFRDHKKLSPEIRTAAERVDPDNGWFLALAAAEIAEGAVTRGKRSEEDKTADKPAVLTVNDDRRLGEALALLHQANGKPRFTSYLAELHRERFALLPPRRDFVSQIQPIALAASANVSSIPFRRFADAWAAAARQCATKGDVAGYRQIIADWHAFVTTSSEDSDAVVDLLVTKVIMLGPASHFRDAARSLGLEEDARYFQKLSDYNQAETKRRREYKNPDTDFHKRKNSFFGGLIGPLARSQVKSPPPFTDADMRPARHADHALLGRVLSGPAWLLFGLAVAFTAFGRYRHNPLTRRLSLRMLDLLRPRDWLLLFFGVLVLPVLWYLFISRLSPLAAREWSITVVSFIPVCGQFGSLVLAMIILPVPIAGRLLKKRGAALQLSPRFSWPGWLAAVATLAAIPMFGAIPHDTPFSKWLLIFSLGLAGVAVLWILGAGTALCRKSPSLRRATMIRMIVPVWVGAMLVMALSLRFHYAEEQSWIQQDRMGEITADSPALGRYEREIIEVMRREIVETLGSLPESR